MLRRAIDTVFQQEDINFALTNRIPRQLLTRLMGSFSTIEQPLVRDASLAVWQLFSGDLHLHEAEKASFASVRDCFTRKLKPGARPIDSAPDVLTSPCDAIVGESGQVDDGELIQAKGFGYTLDDLLGDRDLVERHRHGHYVTLRLTSSMYHRFHAPVGCRVSEVLYISGDTWNVNPIALRRVARLFCKNERVVIPTALDASSESVTIVAVGAILVASIRLTFLDHPLSLRYRGPNRIRCSAAFRKGDEMGYFEHGSTIIVLSTPGLGLAARVRQGDPIRMGEPLLVDRTVQPGPTGATASHPPPAAPSPSPAAAPGWSTR